MAITYSITFPFSALIPEEIANETPDFPNGQYSNEPFETAAGLVLLVNDEFDQAFNNTITRDDLSYDNITTMLSTLVVQDDTIVSSIEFDDSNTALAKLIEVFEPFGITITSVTV
jgi:hypothetical protein